MRTTVDIPDTTYRLLKSRAASEGTSVKEMVLRGVEVVLGEEKRVRRKRVLPVIKSKCPGTINLTNEQIYELTGLP
jgi:hypothetical protein